MANSVHLTGLLRVEQATNHQDIGLSIRAIVFEDRNGRQMGWDKNRKYPILLGGRQAQIVVENNHNDMGKGLPHVVISGRLFQVNGESQCFVLCKHIQFTGVYGHPD